MNTVTLVPRLETMTGDGEVTPVNNLNVANSQVNTTGMAVPKLPPFDPKKICFENYLYMVEANFATYGITQEAMKKNILIVSIGVENFNLLCTLTAPSKPSEKSFEELKECLKRHFIVKPSYHTALHNFRQRVKKDGESLNELYADLKKLGLVCDFGSNFSWMLRDQLFMAVDSQPYFKFLLSESFDLKQVKADALLDRLISLEQAHMSEQKVESENGVGAIRKWKPWAKPNSVVNRDAPVTCRHCGFPHRSESCKLKHLTCHQCGEKGHLKSVCSGKQTKKWDRKPAVRVKQVENHPNEDIDDGLFSVNDSIGSVKPELYNFNLNGHLKPLEIDSGACVSLLPVKVVEQIGAVVVPAQKALTAYGGSKIEVKGKCTVPVKYGMLSTEHTFYIVEYASSICGRDLMQKLKISLAGVSLESRVNKIDLNATNVEELIKSYKTEVNKPIDGVKAKIFLKPDAVPKFQKARAVPLAHRDLVNKAIDELEKNKCVEPIRFSEYASPIVPVLKKDGSMRICVDFKNLNAQLNVEKFPLPRFEEILSCVGDNSYFCKLDLTNAYLQMEVEKEHQKYLGISTEKGLYQFTRLPFGLASAPGIFQKFISQLLGGIEGVTCYLDDILICSPSLEKQLETVKEVLGKLAEANVQLNINKCLVNVQNVKYLGYQIGKEGILPCKEKLRAIADAPVPTNVAEVQSFIGLVTYYNRFVPEFSEILSPLYEVLKKNVKEFMFNDKCVDSFKLCKKKLMEAPILTTFKDKELIVEADASPNGVGAVLLQVEGGVEKPIAFASKRLSEAERNYSQTDKEGLALIFAVKKFKYYILGRKFEMRTDHRPLLALFGRGKSIPVHANARLVRWSILLSEFDYDLCFKPGKQNVVADALSRLPISDGPSSETPNEYVKLIEQLDSKKYSFGEIRDLTAEDPVLTKVVQYLKTGWPKNEVWANEYSNCKLDLSLHDDVVLYRNRVVIPSVIRKEFLDLLHIGHSGMVAMKAEARKYIFWPNLSLDIEEKVKSCNDCTLKNAQGKEPKLEWPQTSKPWQRLHIDYCGPINGKYVLVIIDSFTKFMDAHVCNTPTSQITMELLRKTMSNFGIPSQIVSDNAKYFVSDEIKKFYQKNNIKLLNPSPYHPASNGMGERAVQVLKDGLKKFTEGSMSTRVCRLLFNYRKTVQSVTKESPAFMMFGREFKSPVEIVRQEVSNENDIEHTPGGRYSLNQAVWVRNFGKGERWVPGLIIGKKGLRNYDVKIFANSGELFWRRHSDHIKCRYNDVHFPTKSESNSSKNTPHADVDDEDFVHVQIPAPSTSPNRGSGTPSEINAEENSNTSPSRMVNNKKSRSGRMIIPPNRLDM